VQASGDEEYNDQNVPVGTVVSRRVVDGVPEGMDEGLQGSGQPSGGAPALNPQQVRAPADLPSQQPPKANNHGGAAQPILLCAGMIAVHVQRTS